MPERVTVLARLGRLLVAGGLALALAGAAAGATPSRSVSVTLDWVPNPDHVGIYWARDRGFFARRGLEVSLHSPSDPAAPLKLVALGRTDLAVSYEPELFFSAEKGLPVRAVAALVPVPLNSLIAKASSGIRTARDLRGRSIGISGLPSDYAILHTIERHAGVPRSAVKAVNVGYNLLSSLLAGKVDAILGGYRNVEAIQVAQRTGRQPTVLPVDRLGVPSYDELVVVANADRLRSDATYRDTVRRFLAALVAGTRQARAHPAQAEALMAKVTSEQRSFLARSVPETLRLLAPPGGRPIGCLSVAAWRSYGAWMLRTGLLGKRVDVRALVTAAYLPHRCG